MKLDTRQIVISGLLVALALVLGVTGLGFIPVPPGRRCNPHAHPPWNSQAFWKDLSSDHSSDLFSVFSLLGSWQIHESLSRRVSSLA